MFRRLIHRLRFFKHYKVFTLMCVEWPAEGQLPHFWQDQQNRGHLNPFKEPVIHVTSGITELNISCL